MTPLLMNKRLAAQALGVSVRTVERMIVEKKLPAVMIRGSVRVPIDAVMKLAASAQ